MLFYSHATIEFDNFFVFTLFISKKVRSLRRCIRMIANNNKNQNDKLSLHSSVNGMECFISHNLLRMKENWPIEIANENKRKKNMFNEKKKQQYVKRRIYLPKAHQTFQFCVFTLTPQCYLECLVFVDSRDKRRKKQTNNIFHWTISNGSLNVHQFQHWMRKYRPKTYRSRKTALLQCSPWNCMKWDRNSFSWCIQY